MATEYEDDISLTPYSFEMDVLPIPDEPELLPARQYQGVHFTMAEADMEWVLERIEMWVAEREDVILVGQGVTAMGMGFLLLEWDGRAIDPIFLSVLRHDDTVEDFSVYTRIELKEAR